MRWPQSRFSCGACRTASSVERAPRPVRGRELVSRSWTSAYRQGPTVFEDRLTSDCQSLNDTHEPGGLEYSRRLFEIHGRALLERLGLLSVCSVACVGGTSQNAGMDDAVSRDHTWGPYLTFLLPDPAWRLHGRRLNRALDGGRTASSVPGTAASMDAGSTAHSTASPTRSRMSNGAATTDRNRGGQVRTRSPASSTA